MRRINRARASLLATTALLLGACAVGPRYERPALDVPAAYRGQDETPGRESNASIATLAWWEIYRDPVLQDLLRVALEQNRDVRIAAARVAEARAQAGVARLARFPQIDAAASAERGRQAINGVYATGTRYAAGIDVSFEVDFWRRLASLSDAARADLLATEMARENVRASLVGDVATAYFDLLSLDQQLRITERTVATRQTFYELTRSKFERGAASGLEVARAQATLALARAAVPDLRRQVQQTENQLQLLLGRNPGSIVREPLALESLPQPSEIPAGLPSSLLERRPDLRQAEAQLEGATARVRAARADLFPTIALTGSYGAQSLALADLFTGPARVWSFGLALLQPIINANRNGYLVDAAEARSQQALLQYEQAVAGAFREVSDALIARHDYAEAQLAQAEQVQALRDASYRVHRRYDVGLSSYFEVIDADRDLFAAELLLVGAYRNTQVALVDLYKALGGGWPAHDEKDAVRLGASAR
jgi:outer membrane protein, multidrug efflux system